MHRGFKSPARSVRSAPLIEFSALIAVPIVIGHLLYDGAVELPHGRIVDAGRRSHASRTETDRQPTPAVRVTRRVDAGYRDLDRHVDPAASRG
jgi:hypothetical protein